VEPVAKLEIHPGVPDVRRIGKLRLDPPGKVGEEGPLEVHPGAPDVELRRGICAVAAVEFCVEMQVTSNLHLEFFVWGGEDKVVVPVDDERDSSFLLDDFFTLVGTLLLSLCVLSEGQEGCHQQERDEVNPSLHLHSSF
jgi:hypothetical protein